MLGLAVCLTVLRAATASVLPYGAVMPHGGVGIAGGFGGGQYYGSPMMGQGDFVNGISNYAGDGRHYSGLYSNGMAHESLGAVGGSANGVGYGSNGATSYANQHLGHGGQHINNFGADFQNGNGGFKQSNGFQDAAGKNSVNGFSDVGHNKGQKSNGFHKSYHNVETGQNTKYVDEDQDVGGHHVGQNYGNNFANAYGSGFSGAGANGLSGSNQYFDQSGQHGLAGGSYNGANFVGHGANNYYNGHDLSMKNSHLADNMNNFGQGYTGTGNSYRMGNGYYSSPGISHHMMG